MSLCMSASAKVAVEKMAFEDREELGILVADDMPPVLATAIMVGFIEATCIEAIAPHLDQGEHSVGIHVDVSHIAATPASMSITAEVELLEVNGRKLRFRVRAEDEDGLIGEGLHQRAIIDTGKFNDRLAAKAGRHV